jgi:altronate hydrolase
MSLAQAIVLSSKDNVAVANGRIEPGTSYPVASRHSAIDPGHKVAILPIKAGEAVVKYAQAIGRATEDIAPGTHIHSHNLVFESGRMPVVPPSDPVQASDRDKRVPSWVTDVPTDAPAHVISSALSPA